LRKDESFNSGINEKSCFTTKVLKFRFDRWNPSAEFCVEQFSQYTCDHHSDLPGGGTTALFVNEQHIGLCCQCQSDRLPFARVEWDGQWPGSFAGGFFTISQPSVSAAVMWAFPAT
jgi:hypothetical protein